MPGQDDRELSAAILHDLHQAFQPRQGRMVQIVGFVNEQGHRLLGRTDQFLEFALAFLARRGDLVVLVMSPETS